MRLAQSCSSQDRACENSWIPDLTESGLGGLGVGPGQFPSLSQLSHHKTMLSPASLSGPHHAGNFSPRKTHRKIPCRYNPWNRGLSGDKEALG